MGSTLRVAAVGDIHCGRSSAGALQPLFAQGSASMRIITTRLGTALLAIAFATSCRVPPRTPPPPVAPQPRLMRFEATAYSIEGRTATGRTTREGIVAADPRVLPLGSRIRVHDAGQYSGEYLVADTGRAVKGRTLDIYLADDGEAKRFGRRPVRVELLSREDR